MGSECPNAKKPRWRELTSSPKVLYQESPYQECNFSYVLQRSRSLPLSIPCHSSAPNTSHMSVLGLEGPIAPSALSLFSPGRASWQTSWLTSLQSSSSCLLLTFSPPSFKCSPMNFLRVLTSGSSYSALKSAILVCHTVSLTLFWLPPLVRAGVPSEAQASWKGICPLGYVTSHCTFS